MVKEVKTEEKVVPVKSTSSKKDYVHAVGRRREAVARVRLYPTVKEAVIWGEQTIKEGQMLVNGKPIEQYFSSLVAKNSYLEPFVITKTEGKFALTISVAGGGQYGQLDATVLGIARALIKHKPEFRGALKKRGLLTRDSRIRERRKVGTGGKARRKKQSPKR